MRGLEPQQNGAAAQLRKQFCFKYTDLQLTNTVYKFLFDILLDIYEKKRVKFFYCLMNNFKFYVMSDENKRFDYMKHGNRLMMRGSGHLQISVYLLYFIDNTYFIKDVIL